MSRHPKPSGAGGAASATPAEPAGVVASGPPAAVEAHGLSKEYGDRPALAPIDLRIEAGEIVALIGHNGSGKTTFMRMAAGLVEPTAGRVAIGGHGAGSVDARRALSWIADQPTFYDDLSMWEHLEYVAGLHGADDWSQHAADLLGYLGLFDRADDLPNGFSRGLRQKAAIALAFVRPFEVLCVDEPFVGLDASGKAALGELLAQAHEDGATLVVATHELGFVERAGRVIALRDGQIAFDGPSNSADAVALVHHDGAASSADTGRTATE